MHKLNLFLLVLFCLIISGHQQNVLAANPVNEVSVSQDEFIALMVKKHKFNEKDLNKVLNQTIVSQTILDAISRPAEKKLTWHQYRQIFIKDKRINQGVDFMQENKSKLDEAEKIYGVPAEIITAIIGVETFYGRIAGSYRVVDALNTLAFHYPKRADFFRSEFEHFLLLAREQGFNPNSLKGSYAGAMGMPQFISSSYRNFAIDFDGDDVIDIWNNPNDAIGSVANYFSEHGWIKGEPVTVKVTVIGDAYKQALKKGLNLDIHEFELKGFGIKTNASFEKNEMLKLFEYELDKGSEYWLAHKNFYVITRYNHSHLYAMAVYQLAMEIKQRLNKKNSNTK
jgi:membrane-bound lytic murein transglycosylase B